MASSVAFGSDLSLYLRRISLPLNLRWRLSFSMLKNQKLHNEHQLSTITITIYL